MSRRVYDDDVDRAPRRRRRGPLGIIAAVVVLVLVAAVAVAVVLATRSTDDAKKDVAVKTCTPDPGGGKPTASGQIVNHSSKGSNYVIRLRFNDAEGNNVSEGVATVRDVEAGQTADWQLTGARSADGPVTCELRGVSRTHVPGQD